MKNITIIVIIMLAALALAACGMNEQSPDSSTAGTVIYTTVEETVGMQECLSCHSDYFNPSALMNVVGDSPGSYGWLNGAHGNLNVDPGGPPKGPHSATSSCSPCHNQLGEGGSITAIENALGIDLGGVNRDVISCESCHGSGTNHFGTGYVEYPRPDASRCGQCHTDELPSWHTSSFSAERDIYAKYTGSKHAAAAGATHQPTDDFMAACSKCHTDEGAKMYMTSPYYTLFSQPNITTGVTTVQCRTCHNPHNAGEFALPDTDDGFGNITASGQYRTCESCHGLNGALHGEGSGYSWGTAGVENTPGVGDFHPGEIIYDTHVDNPDTEFIEGYVVDASDPKACSGCHDVHSTDISINEQWASSGHGGYILTAKELAFANIADPTPSVALDNLAKLLNGTDPYGSVQAVGILNSPAWVDHDFKEKTGGRSNKGNQACQRCHTSTGFKNLMANAVSYDPADNEFAATGEQREMLYCWACHKNISDDLRDDWGIKNTSPYLAVNTVSDARILSADTILGDTGSNVCVACHSGRETGLEIPEISAAKFTNTSFINPHYLAAGGVLFRTAGYEYADALTYDDAPFPGFMHNTLGAAGAGDNSAGDNGPCVACHMRSDEGHTLEAVVKNGSDVITDVPTFDNTCSACHQDKASLITLLNTQKTGFENALEALEAALEVRGFFYSSAYPYFYNSPYDEGYTDIYNSSCSKNFPIKNWETGGDNTYSVSAVVVGPGPTYDDCEWKYTGGGDPGTGDENMGAAFIFSLLHHEPGAYAHNSRYTRRLIYDAIDWLDDNIINESVDVSSSPAADAYLGSGRP